MKLLLIGDVHATLEDLADCTKLADLVVEVAEAQNPDGIAFLGDLYDTFALKNVAVEKWWMDFLNRLPTCEIRPTLLVGNHDRPGDSSQEANALQAHAHQARVIAKPDLLTENIGVIPFFFKAEDFVDAANDPYMKQARTLLCHQALLGGKYETGLPIELRHDASAVDPAALPQQVIISGHIHTPQYVGKRAWYPGAPRWRNNVSDANIERYIYLVTFEGGIPKAIQKFPTGDVCRRIWKIDDIEGSDTQMPLNVKECDRLVVDITGTSAYIESRKQVWSGARIRTFPTDRSAPKLSEALGMTAAWATWTKAYEPKFGTPIPDLEALYQERTAPRG